MFLFFATSFSSSSDRFIMFILAHNYFFNIWLWLLLGWLLLRWLFLRWLLACANQILVIRRIWASQNLDWQQNSLGRNWMPEHFFGLLPCITSTRSWLLRPVKIPTSKLKKTPSGKIPWLMGSHATPLVTLFFIITMLLTRPHAMPVVI